MSEPHDPPFAAHDDQAHALLIVIVPAGTLFEAVVQTVRTLGLSGTVVDGKGLTAALNEEMPIFGGLASMLPNSAGSRVLLCATTAHRARDAMAMLESRYQRADRPIALVVPVAHAIGVRARSRDLPADLQGPS